ncbi:hypothetical protein NDU88_006241 [Pleurodeles waltl]|uniref:Uncharacterized protein n=1 Tax=Pleurodeles waltl TaxID=8319 RepID=A0AAV7MYN1_PLEWA|nr:hypothetical protein NDU88_006241 [Pleurodeles waltl]
MPTDGLTLAFYKAYEDILIPQMATLFEEMTTDGSRSLREPRHPRVCAAPLIARLCAGSGARIVVPRGHRFSLPLKQSRRSVYSAPGGRISSRSCPERLVSRAEFGVYFAPGGLFNKRSCRSGLEV